MVTEVDLLYYIYWTHLFLWWEKWKQSNLILSHKYSLTKFGMYSRHLCDRFCPLLFSKVSLKNIYLQNNWLHSLNKTILIFLNLVLLTLLLVLFYMYLVLMCSCSVMHIIFFSHYCNCSHVCLYPCRECKK